MLETDFYIQMDFCICFSHVIHIRTSLLHLDPILLQVKSRTASVIEHQFNYMCNSKKNLWTDFCLETLAPHFIIPMNNRQSLMDPLAHILLQKIFEIDGNLKKTWYMKMYHMSWPHFVLCIAKNVGCKCYNPQPPNNLVRHIVQFVTKQVS